jgi:hypothetical protein
VRHDVGATTARVHGQDEARGEGGGGGNGGLGPRRHQHGREWEGVGIERATSNGGVARHLTEGGPHDEAQPSVVSAWKAELPHPARPATSPSNRQTTSPDCYRFCPIQDGAFASSDAGWKEASNFSRALTDHRFKASMSQNMEKK